MENATLDRLIAEGAAIKTRMDADKSRLAEIHATLQGMALFPDGKNTAHLVGAGFDVKIARKANIKFDQAKLESLRVRMGNDGFFKVFKWEFKPVGQKQLDAFTAYGNPEWVSILNDAITITPGAPSVTYTPLEV